MLVLGIETSCDETAASVVQDGRVILSNVLASQADLHAHYGGVVPELGCRRHVDLLPSIIDQAIQSSGIQLTDLDLIAVAQGPGLIGALLIGVNAAKALSLAVKKPLIGVNHVQAHLYAAIMSSSQPIHYPCLGIVLSGGHTALFYMRSFTEYSLIASTVDDAIGEAFDKVARILGYPYPGGPKIEQLAKQGDREKFSFGAGQVKEKSLDFSFSGLKTAVLYGVKNQELSMEEKCSVAASFQHAAFVDVVRKTIKAARQYGCHTLLFGGGVTHNQALRKLFHEQAQEFIQIWPTSALSLDNAAMIAGLGYHLHSTGKKEDALTLQASSQKIKHGSPLAQSQGWMSSIAHENL